jgi:hypothetical protein
MLSFFVFVAFFSVFVLKHDRWGAPRGTYLILSWLGFLTTPHHIARLLLKHFDASQYTKHPCDVSRPVGGTRGEGGDF